MPFYLFVCLSVCALFKIFAKLVQRKSKFVFVNTKCAYVSQRLSHFLSYPKAKMHPCARYFIRLSLFCSGVPKLNMFNRNPPKVPKITPPLSVRRLVEIACVWLKLSDMMTTGLSFHIVWTCAWGFVTINGRGTVSLVEGSAWGFFHIKYGHDSTGPSLAVRDSTKTEPVNNRTTRAWRLFLCELHYSDFFYWLLV